MNRNKLYVFDIDGTLIDDADLHKEIYTDNLNNLVQERYGEEGLRITNSIRKNNRGKGELALLVLGIPYARWFERITDEQVALLKPQPSLVNAVRSLEGIKVIFTGTSLVLARKFLRQVGFQEDDFQEIIAFDSPAVIPLKLSADRLVFGYLLAKYEIPAERAYMLGNEYEFDLLPAKAAGLNTIEIKHDSGKADKAFPDIMEAISYLRLLT